jgi:hypothetical protein
MVLILFQLRYQKLLDANPTTPTNNKTEKNKVRGVGGHILSSENEKLRDIILREFICFENYQQIIPTQFGSNCPLVSEQEIFLHELSNGHGLLVSEQNIFFHHQMAMVH